MRRRSPCRPAAVRSARWKVGAARFCIGCGPAPDNRLERCKIKDPSVNNWPAIVEAVQGNIIADFPVINKSFNLSYSGTDR